MPRPMKLMPRPMKPMMPRQTKDDEAEAVDAGAGEISVADEAHVIDEVVASDVAIEANPVD